MRAAPAHLLLESLAPADPPGQLHEDHGDTGRNVPVPRSSMSKGCPSSATARRCSSISGSNDSSTVTGGSKVTWRGDHPGERVAQPRPPVLELGAVRLRIATATPMTARRAGHRTPAGRNPIRS